MATLQRALNSTGRQRIKRERVTISLKDGATPQDPPIATAKISLDKLKLPAEATVGIEAYYKSSSMRFGCGTVAAPMIPERMVLTDIDRGGTVRFRLLVIAADGTGKILAAADGLRPADENDSRNREPLLPLRETDLGNELWRVDIDSRSGPILLVTTSIPGFAGRLKSSPLLQGAVLPHALRLVLQQLRIADEDEDSWSGPWRVFLNELDVPSEPEDEDEETVQAWIEQAVRRFCEVKNFAGRVRDSGEIMEIQHG